MGRLSPWFTSRGQSAGLNASLLIGTSNTDANQSTEATMKDQKNIKSKVTFFFAHMDKIPALALASLIPAIATAKLLPDTVRYKDTVIQILCASTPVMVCGSVSLFAYSGYYKEKEDVDGVGFRFFSFLVLAQHIMLLVLLCFIVLGVDKANTWGVIVPAVLTGIAIVLTWQVPVREPKTLYCWLRDRCKKKREMVRDNTSLPLSNPST